MLGIFFYVTLLAAVVFWNQKNNFSFVDPTMYQAASVNYNAVGDE